MDKNYVTAVLEAILFAAGEPVPISRIAQVLGVTEAEVSAAAEELTAIYQERGSGLRLLRLAEKLGLSCDEDSLVPGGGSGEEYTVNCAWKGGRVYNAQLTFFFTADSLMMVTGTRLFDDVEQDSGDGVMDELTAMMRFYELVIGEQWPCSRLEGLDVGYVQSVTVSDASTLTPVWHFSTDTGQLYINAVTGRGEIFN